jgi:hypothetical protein
MPGPGLDDRRDARDRWTLGRPLARRGASLDRRRRQWERAVNAFTNEPFTGNLAGVVLLDGPEWLAGAVRQRIAPELGCEAALGLMVDMQMVLR